MTALLWYTGRHPYLMAQRTTIKWQVSETARPFPIPNGLNHQWARQFFMTAKHELYFDNGLVSGPARIKWRRHAQQSRKPSSSGKQWDPPKNNNNNNNNCGWRSGILRSKQFQITTAQSEQNSSKLRRHKANQTVPNYNGTSRSKQFSLRKRYSVLKQVSVTYGICLHFMNPRILTAGLKKKYTRYL